jgi:hypothetical protein
MRFNKALMFYGVEQGAGAVTASGNSAEAPLAPGGSAAKPPEPDQAAKAAAEKAAADKAAADKIATDKAAAEKAAADEARSMGGTLTAGGKNLTIPQSKMKEIKDNERRKANEALARELGYSSVEEMRARGRAGTTTQQQPPKSPDGKPTEPEPQQRPGSRREAQLQRERDELAAKASREAKAARRVAAELAEVQARVAMADRLRDMGVRKVKLALHMIEDHIDMLSEEQLSTFKEEELIESWKKTDSYLFDAVTVPANTGPGPGAPAPVRTNGGSGNDKKPVNCMDMTPAQFEQ